MKLKYKKIFLPGTRERTRIDSILDGLPDPYPYSSGSEAFETVLAEIYSPTMKRKKKKKGDTIGLEIAQELTPRIHEALGELLDIRIERNI